MEITAIWLDLCQQVSRLWVDPIDFNQLKELMTDEESPYPPWPKCPYGTF